jgi:hypothetical protein
MRHLRRDVAVEAGEHGQVAEGRALGQDRTDEVGADVAAGSRLVSTITAWFQISPRRLARLRATTSVAAPGAKGTITRTGLSG